MFMAAEEAFDMALLEGVRMGEDKESVLGFVEDICRRTAENRSSMLQDVSIGRRTEIDYINGAILEVAKRHGASVPVNMILTTLLKKIEEGRKNC
jgi:2-dehydropantoate 2-reductase